MRWRESPPCRPRLTCDPAARPSRIRPSSARVPPTPSPPRVQFEQIRQKEPKPFARRRLFIYYNERVMEHTVGRDAGAQIRDGMKSVDHIGACPETNWPSVRHHEVRPEASHPRLQGRSAGEGPLLSAGRPDPRQMKGCLASGLPIVLGISVYESFESQQVARSGIVPMPANSEKLLGGHAILAVGYNDAEQLLRDAQFLGHVVGDARLLHDPVRVPDRFQPLR
jgi:hypothetical protein